jgi:hypothetical protein
MADEKTIFTVKIIEGHKDILFNGHNEKFNCRELFDDREDDGDSQGPSTGNNTTHPPPSGQSQQTSSESL